jgi:hypothetical protein
MIQQLLLLLAATRTHKSSRELTNIALATTAAAVSCAGALAALFSWRRCCWCSQRTAAWQQACLHH